MPLLPFIFTQICKLIKHQVTQLGYKCYHGGVIEAQDLQGMVPTPTAYIHKVFDFIHILSIEHWIHHHALTATLVVGPAL